MKRLMMRAMVKLMGLPTCEEVAELAYAYLEEDLPSDTVRKLERHLRGCRNCSRFVESYRQVARPDRLARKIPLDPEFERRIARFLKDQLSKERT